LLHTDTTHSPCKVRILNQTVRRHKPGDRNFNFVVKPSDFSLRRSRNRGKASDYQGNDHEGAGLLGSVVVRIT
jgi:hypothetical protein